MIFFYPPKYNFETLTSIKKPGSVTSLMTLRMSHPSVTPNINLSVIPNECEESQTCEMFFNLKISLFGRDDILN